MILYQLHCDQNHKFEGWFKNSDAYDTQAARRLVSCPICNSLTVSKAPMAPRIAKGVAEGSEESHGHWEEIVTVSNTPEILAKALIELKKALSSACENVGERFPEEARKIHYGEAKKRPIYGEASFQELKSLDEEGIDFAPLPWVTRYDA